MKDLLQGVSERLSSVREMISGVIFSVSSEHSEDASQEYDEKHYFVIPFAMSEYGFSLHIMRSLPPGVPELNALPKRRVFHFADEHAEYALRYYLTESARQVAEDNTENSSLEALADDIDSLDKKLTYGMLIAGGTLALINPVVGAGIALKALLPGMTGVVNRNILKPLGKKLTEREKEKNKLAAAEKIQKQFSESSTLRVINPVLQELQLALKTTENEHDPLSSFNLADGSIPELKHDRWRSLTEAAICAVYHDVLRDPSKHKEAHLGPEDIRWLSTFFSAGKSNERN